MKNIPGDILKELRYQFETDFRLSLYKTPEFNFYPSLGTKNIFKSSTDKEYGYIGTIHLMFIVDEQTGPYWKSIWYDKPIEAIRVAETLQKEKIINEDYIINYQMHYIDMIYGRKNTGIVLLS